MPKESLTLSEDDIRTKIVYQWLKDCGLKDTDIHIEYSINIRLGKGTKTIHSRTDILVTNSQNMNLLIVEVKRPDHCLNNEDKLQGLSYARALAKGGIAPFTILTNGKDTVIYDSVTGNNIEGTTVPANHPYVQNGFRASGNALQARAEALEYLISLSPENLLLFCKAQVEQRIGLLKSNDLFSGKKYIPQLYIERQTAKEELKKKLFDEKTSNRVILVIGPPQHGKTCFLCHTVETYLKKGIPVLFYPAISLRKGLLKEIQEDFEWNLGDTSNSFQLIHKLQKITSQIGKEIIIFVDGWNEMIEDALVLNDECQRLQQTNIKLVISTTSPSLPRLLQDESGNLSHIAEEVKLNVTTIRQLTSKPLNYTKELNIIQIGNFDYHELIEGKKLHEKAYNTKFADNSNLPQDPFYLRLAAETYANSPIPNFATRTDLIRKSLSRKGLRRGIQDIDLFSGLHVIAQIMVEKDPPISCLDLPHVICNDSALSKWLESAILIRLYKNEMPEIDFYYTHDRDFCIAILSQKLDERLLHSEKEIFYDDLLKITKTESGCSALRWFLSCPEYTHILEEVFKWVVSQGKYTNIILKILSDSILNQVNLNNNLSFDWLETYIDKLIEAQNNKQEFNENLCKLIYSLLFSFDTKKEMNKYEYWLRLLVKYDDIHDFDVQGSLVYELLGREDMEDDFDEDSHEIKYLVKLISDKDKDIVYNALAILTNISYSFVLRKLPSFIYEYQQNNHPATNELLEKICRCILYHLWYIYYGDMCPGWLSSTEKGDAEVIEEYYKQKKLWWPILKMLHPESETYEDIIKTLQKLSEYVIEEDPEPSIPPCNDPRQLSFNF